MFTGWYLDEALTQRAEAITLNRDMSVYAGWQIDMTDPDNTGVSDWLNTREHTRYLQGHPGGLFGVDDNMTRAEAAQMFFNLLLNKEVSATVQFSDVETDAWYAKAVNTLASIGVIKGVGEDRFAPEQSITRAEFTAMAMRFAKLDASGENKFSDVNETDWYYDAVVGSVKYGWITGYPDGTFGPENTITRGEVNAIVNRMLGRSGDADYIRSHAEALMHFDDLNQAHWAYCDIMEAVNGHDYEKANGTLETGIIS